MLKILIIGNQNWGKTCFVNRYINNTFSNKIPATVAWEYSVKEVDIEHTKVKLNIWDIAGQDRLGGISKLFCRNATAAIVVSDIVQEDTLEDAIEWKEQVDEYWGTRPDGSTIPMILAVNKYDLIKGYEDSNKELEPYMTEEYIRKFARKHGFVGCLRTSAKTGENVDATFNLLLENIVKKNTHKNPKTGIQEVDFKSMLSIDSVKGSEFMDKGSKFKIVSLQPPEEKKKKGCWG